MNATILNHNITKNITTPIIQCVLDTSIYDTLPKIMKITASVLYLLFFLLAIKIKEMRTRHMLFLFNLSFIGLSTTGFYGFTSFNTYCESPSIQMCQYQALFAYYTIYLSAYGVVALALYRLACVKFIHLKTYITVPRIVGVIGFIWVVPIFAIVIPAFALEIPIFYNLSSASCRMDLSKNIGYFISYCVLANVLPSILIFIIDIVIFFTLKASKKRVNVTKIDVTNMTATKMDSSGGVVTKPSSHGKPKKIVASVEFRLLLQLVTLFIVFEIYAVTNTILLFQTSTTNKLVNPEGLKILRLFRWGYHVINPIIYLFMHPVLLKKFKELF